VQRRKQGFYQQVAHQGTVLVSGGAGYIGSLLIPRLLERGYRVRVLDRLLYGDGGLRRILGHPGLELIAADFRNVRVVREATQAVDAVIHLGAIVGDSACALDEILTQTTNVDATEAMAEACQALGVSRFIFVSTCSVYGASEGALDETSPLNPVSLYARTKIAAEQLLLAQANVAFAPVILRLGTAYGLSPRPRFDLVVNLLTAQAVVEGQAAIHGGSQWRPFIHVDDIGRALILTLEAPHEDVAGQVFNVGANEHNHQLQELGTVIGDLVPTAQVVTLDHVVDRRNYFVRFDKVDRVLGFAPTHSLRDGVREIKWALESGVVRQFRESHHHNHLWLRDLPVDPWPAGAMLDVVSAFQGTLVEH
jgi:nucleoside-diphosphate-sugar epimerase